MIKAAALYLVIIISLMIAIISASLLSVAFYYKLEQQKKARIDHLQDNLSSASAILLSSGFAETENGVAKDLYGDGKDSVVLHQMKWGVFRSNTAVSSILGDTLKSAFLSGITFTNTAAIYLADEDRPLSVSGTTQITGDGELPKSGLKQSYVEGKPYAGKELIKGKIKTSSRDLPALEQKWIDALLASFARTDGEPITAKDSLTGSFYSPAKVYQLNSMPELAALKIKGKIILISDTTLTLHSNLVLEDVLIYAPGIIVKDGFTGSCQLFARDSIIIGKNCIFSYPSFAGVFKPEGSKIQAKISLGTDSRFSGLLLSYEKTRSDLQTIISLGKGTRVNGEVFATGFIQLEAPVTVHGKVYAKRFMMRRSGVFYENYLIDVVLNRKLLSKYYLGTPLFQGADQQNEILKWLN